jgi:hypothetical protein
MHETRPSVLIYVAEFTGVAECVRRWQQPIMEGRQRKSKINREIKTKRQRKDNARMK